MAGGYAVTYSVVDQATKQIDAINRRITAMRAPLDRQAKSLAKFVDVSGLKDVATGFDSIAKSAFSAFTEMSKSVPVLGTIMSAATVAGLVHLADGFAKVTTSLVRNADRIGITTDKLQNLRDMMTLAGGNADDMQASLQALTTISRNAALGLDSTALAAFNRLNIALKDGNGNFRSASDLLPEVLSKIGDLQDPTDRARVASALLGDAQAKVYETFIHSTKSYADWQKEAAGYVQETDAQKVAAQQWNEALGGLEVGFSHLAIQVGATIATALTPLVKWMSDFVKNDTPAVVSAINTMVTQFPLLTAAGLGVATWFSTKFVASMLGSFARVLLGLKNVGAAGAAAVEGAETAAGVGLAGTGAALGGVVGGAYLLNSQVFPSLFGDRPLGLARSDDTGGRGANATPGEGPHHGAHPTYPPHGGGPRAPPAGTGLAAPPAGTGLAATPFGALISRGEGGYSSVNRGAAGGYRAGTEDLANKTVAEVQADQAAQRYNAAGRYQIIRGTLDSAVKALGLTGNEKFDQATQDRIFSQYLAGQKRPEIAAYLSGRSNDLKAAQLAASEEWASVADPNTGQSHYAGTGNNRASIGVAEMADALTRTRAQLAMPSAPPVNIAANGQAAGSVSGSVSIDITHRNPPPNTTLAATALGPIDISPPRVERQDLSSP